MMIWELAEGWIFGAFSILCFSNQEPLHCAHCLCLPVAPLLAAMEIFSLCRQNMFYGILRELIKTLF